METIRRQLAKAALKKKITKVEVLVFSKRVWPKNFSERLVGQEFLQMERYGKLLVFVLAKGWKLAVHLKMTGQLVYRAIDGKVRAVGGHPIVADLQSLPNRFTRVIFSFADGGRLFFNDVRKFGYLKLLSAAEAAKVAAEYGPDPLSKKFSQQVFDQILARRPRQKIKQLLLDQKMLAGVGNIYADEACFYAGIRPQRRVGEITAPERKKLRLALLAVLKKSLAVGGTSAENYVDAWGRRGGFVPLLKVYGREGERCKKCGEKIIKTRLGGRGTHYCPHCQR